MSDLVWSIIFLVLFAASAIMLTVSPSLTILAAVIINLISSWSCLILYKIGGE